MSDESNILTSALPSRRMIGNMADMSDHERAANFDNRTTPAGGFSESVRLAPNGKPSNLTTAEYARATSLEFKAEHGDWETWAKINAIQKMAPVASIPISGINGTQAKEAYKNIGTVTASDGVAVRFVASMFGKLLFDKRRPLAYSVIPYFKQLLENSVLAYEEAERDPNKHKNITGFKNYVSKITVDGTDYYVRFTVQIAKPNQHQFHGAFVSDIATQRASLNTYLTDFLPGKGVTTSPLVDDKLQHWLNSVKPSDIKISLDENNEPRLSAADSDICPNLSRPSEGTPLSARLLPNAAFFAGIGKLQASSRRVCNFFRAVTCSFEKRLNIRSNFPFFAASSICRSQYRLSSLYKNVAKSQTSSGVNLLISTLSSSTVIAAFYNESPEGSKLCLTN